MNPMKSTKYGLSPEEIEKRSLANERFKTVFNMHRIEKTQRLHRRLDKYDVMKYSAKRKKLRERPFVGEKVLVLAERFKKKAAPGKFYKQSAQNVPYFNKDKTFIIRKILTVDDIKYCRLEDALNNRKLKKRSQRTELFAVRGNFVV